MEYLLATGAAITAAVIFLHWYSYRRLKSYIVGRRRWGLNICCGTTDGGGVNADILQHGDVPNFVRLDSIYRLPPRIPLPFSRRLQARVGQKIAA